MPFWDGEIGFWNGNVMNEIRRAVTWEDVFRNFPEVDKKNIKRYYIEQAKAILKETNTMDVEVGESLALLYLSGIYHGVETLRRLRAEQPEHSSPAN